eukprot:10386965-Alexandrium_andersonii.AAC.1
MAHLQVLAKRHAVEEHTPTGRLLKQPDMRSEIADAEWGRSVGEATAKRLPIMLLNGYRLPEG